MSYSPLTARRRGANENISSFGLVGFGRDYTDFATWEALTQGDLVLDDRSERLEWYNDGPFTDLNIFVSGSTTDATRFRSIAPAGDPLSLNWQGHLGRPNTGLTLHTIGVRGILISEDNFGLYDIDVNHLYSSAGTVTGVQVDGGADVKVVGCLVKSNNNNGNAFGFRVIGSSSTDVKFIDCVAYKCKGKGMVGDGNITKYFYNCTSVLNGEEGFKANLGTCVLKNYLSGFNGGDDYTGSTAFFTGSDYISSSDSTATGRGTNVEINQVYTFISEFLSDFHLHESDTGARGFGTALDTDPVYAFDDDIDRVKNLNWYVGADCDNVALALEPVKEEILYNVEDGLRRYVYQLPSLTPGEDSLRWSLGVGESAGVIRHMRVSFPGSTQISFYLSADIDAPGGEISEVIGIDSLSSPRIDNDLHVAFANDDLTPVGAAIGYTGNPYLHTRIRNEGANDSGTIIIDLGVI